MSFISITKVYDPKAAVSKKIKTGIFFACFVILIAMYIFYSGFVINRTAALIGLTVLGMLIYLVDFNFKHKAIGYCIDLAIMAVIPAACFWTFETLTHKMSSMINTAIYLNLFFYYWVYFVVFFITGRSGAAFTGCSVIINIIAAVNYFVQSFRGNPLVPWDIYSVSTAASVAGNYSLTVSYDLALHGCLFLILIILSTKTKIKFKHPVFRVAATGLCMIPAYFFVSFLWQPNLKWNSDLNMTLFNTKYMHSKNGFFVSFVIDLNFMEIDKPKDYSSEYALELLDEQPEDTTENPDELPNVICIMNETFSDLSVLGDFSTNKDYMPFMRSILNGEVENTISGYTYVSVLGGNTANSEFEFLTGNSMAFLPNGSIPYQQFIRKGVSSIVDQFNELGYETYGTHPYRDTGWNRNVIYELMGFDKIFFRGSFPYETKLRNYISDKADFDSILKWYNSSDEPKFIFNVTMQNHSNYGGSFENFDPQITAKFEHTSSSKYLNNYLSLMYETDQDIEYLLNELEKSEKPVVVVFFGDHQPNDYVVKPIYKEYGIDFDNQTLEQDERRHMTPFFIWANYDIESQKDVSISLNYLNILLFQTVGLKMDDYQTFRKTLWENVPVMNASGYMDQDGTFRLYDDAEGQTEELLDQYQNIQYYRMKDMYK